MPPPRTALVALLSVLLGVALACARPGRTHPVHGAPAAQAGEIPPQGAPPLHLSDVAQQGDPARRASMRFVLQGLDADATGSTDLAADLYQRALQVDPSNPYAYLALGRQRAEGPEPARALAYLEKAQVLFGAQKAETPSVEADLCGLRALALEAAGRSAEAEQQMARAKALAPDIWRDGRLDADELR